MRSLVYPLVAFVIVIGLNLAFSQRVEDGIPDNIKVIRDKYKPPLMEITGVQDMSILVKRGGGFAFNVITNERVDGRRIPKTIEGIPVRITVHKVRLNSDTIDDDPSNRAIKIRERHKSELLQIPGVQNIATLWDRGEYIFNVIVDKTVDPSIIPKSLGGIPVIVTVDIYSHLIPVDKAYERAKAIQVRYENTLFKCPGVVGVGIGKEGEQYVFRVLVTEKDDIEYLPLEIEGIKVIGIISGPIKSMSEKEVKSKDIKTGDVVIWPSPSERHPK